MNNEHLRHYQDTDENKESMKGIGGKKLAPFAPGTPPFNAQNFFPVLSGILYDQKLVPPGPAVLPTKISAGCIPD
jgi:hypothetical protein